MEYTTKIVTKGGPGWAVRVLFSTDPKAPFYASASIGDNNFDACLKIAQLISAAPKMYKACKKSRQLLMKSDLPIENMEAFDLLGDLDRSIAKVEGES